MLKIIMWAVVATAGSALAIAYVGPGAGISLLGALWGLLLGIFMAIGVVLFWPIRAMIRKWRGRANTSDAAAEAGRLQQSDAANEPTPDPGVPTPQKEAADSRSI